MSYTVPVHMATVPTCNYCHTPLSAIYVNGAFVKYWCHRCSQSIQSTGWQCTICGAVYSPFVSKCENWHGKTDAPGVMELKAELVRVTQERDALKAKLSRRDTCLDEALNSGDGTYRP